MKRIRAGEQLALPLVRSRELASAIAQLPFPIAPRLVRRAVRRVLKGLPEVAPVKPAELWTAREMLERRAVLDQVRKEQRCRARNATGRNSARGLAAYVATAEGGRVERAIRKLSEQVQHEMAR